MSHFVRTIGSVIFFVLWAAFGIFVVGTYARKTLDSAKEKDPFGILLGICFAAFWAFAIIQVLFDS